MVYEKKGVVIVYGVVRSVASEPRGPRGQRTPHFLERGVKRGQGHRIYFRYLDRWIIYSILQILQWKLLIFA